MSPRKMTPAQVRSALQKAQRAVDQYNREVRRRNATVKKAIND